jgi:replication-associated recombination protein RarA
MSDTVSTLFTERFRPKTLETLIAPPRVKEELSKGLVQNILLYSPSPGTGKTSTSYIISKPYTSLYLNGSAERGIDTVRERIGKFCSTISLEGGKEKLKCVVIDEFDGFTQEGFFSLKTNIEKYANIARFVCTCNYIDKIPEAIRSRFNCIAYGPVNAEEEAYLISEYKKRIGSILTAAKITCTPEVLDKFIENDFPDMRSMMNKCQSLYLRGVKELNEKNFNINYDFEDLFKICIEPNDKPWDNYKLIIANYASKIDDALCALGNDFPNYLQANAPSKLNKLPLVIISVAEHQAQSAVVIDKVISLLSAVFKIQTILNS